MLTARLAVSFLLLFLINPVSAAPVEVLVVSNEGAIHERILAAARAELTTRGSRARLQPIRGDELPAALERGDDMALVVTLGSRAALDLRHHIPVPVLHAAIPMALYPSLLASPEPDLHPHGHSALFLDQPATRQIEAIRLALPQLQQLGVLLSPGQEATLEPLYVAARDRGIEIIDAVVPEKELLIPRVEQLLRYADALLITPDANLYNRYTLQKVLLAAYRQRKPVIGLSAAYVKAGALLAVHADTEAIGHDLGEAIAHFIETNRLDPPGHVRRFAIVVNHHVARSLGLTLPADQVLLKSLQQSEVER
jgi:ABC-type uncharacterized transport system substrate-binding protein